MKKIIFFLLLGLFSSSFAEDLSKNMKIILETFHRAGITKCDKLIIKHDNLDKINSSWHYVLDYNQNLVSITTIFGEKNDTVKNTNVYTQSKNECLVSLTSTVTFEGNCKDNIDENFWHKRDELPNLDYFVYKNKGGVSLFTKEIKIGNSNLCIKEFSSADSYKFSK